MKGCVFTLGHTIVLWVCFIPEDESSSVIPAELSSRLVKLVKPSLPSLHCNLTYEQPSNDFFHNVVLGWVSFDFYSTNSRLKASHKTGK